MYLQFPTSFLTASSFDNGSITHTSTQVTTSQWHVKSSPSSPRASNSPNPSPTGALKGPRIGQRDVRVEKLARRASLPGSLKDFQAIEQVGQPSNTFEKERESLSRINLLHEATKKNNQPAVKNLIDNGANPNLVDLKGRTPLQIAVKLGHSEIVAYLIEQGANPRAMDKDGSTPLHIAVKLGRSKIVACLIGQGIDVNSKDRKGRTPLELAKKYGQTEVEQVLSKGNMEELLSKSVKRASTSRDLLAQLPFKYVDSQYHPDFSVLGSGAYNTVYKVTYKVEGKDVIEVFKLEGPLIDENARTQALGIDPKDPKTVFRNCLYAAMSERLGLDLAPRTRLGIYKGQLYTVMQLAEGLKSGGQEVKVKVIEKCELANSLAHQHKQWEAAKEKNPKEDWQAYIKRSGLINELAAYGMTGVKEGVLEADQRVWYGTALVAAQAAIDLEDLKLHAALSAMQLLDLLLFQVDRNLGNFFIKTDAEGKFLKLTTIDNDFCVSNSYLDKTHLKESNSEIASCLLFPAWVEPGIAKKFLELQNSGIESVFKDFRGIFGKPEIQASKKMLVTLKDHLKAIAGQPASAFVEDSDSQLYRLKRGIEALQETQKRHENQMWQRSNKLLAAKGQAAVRNLKMAQLATAKGLNFWPTTG